MRSSALTNEAVKAASPVRASVKLPFIVAGVGRK